MAFCTRLAAGAISAVLLLSGCVSPLRDVDRLSAIELADETPAVLAAPIEADTASGGGFLSGLLGRSKAKPALSPTDLAVQAALGGGGGEGEALDAATQVAAIAPETEPAPRRGLLGLLRRAQSADSMPDDATMIAASAPIDETVQTDEALVQTLVDPDKQAQIVDAVPSGQERPRRGLFGLLSGARAKSAANRSENAPVRTASIAPVGLGRRGSGLDGQSVPAGTQLPPGAVARVCDAPRTALGKQVARYPKRGPGYKIYDSKPRGKGARPFYVTGFSDDCARTFTASLALFAGPELHEQIRYGVPAKTHPYSSTDRAYEKIKGSVCSVGRGTACGSKVSLLQKDTAFISVYHRPGGRTWTEILLHRGEVEAVSRKP